VQWHAFTLRRSQKIFDDCLKKMLDTFPKFFKRLFEARIIVFDVFRSFPKKAEKPKVFIFWPSFRYRKGVASST